MSIGVLIATYNGERFIEEQLDSIIAQTIKVDEIVICDDVSTDKTYEIISKYADIHKDFNFKLIRNEKSLGVTKNFEKAFMNSTSDILFFCDQDDIWKKDKIELFMSVFNKGKNINMVFSDADIVDENAKLLGYTQWDGTFLDGKNSCERGEIMICDKNIFKKRLLYRNIVTGMSMAVKKTFLSEIIPFNDICLHDDYIAIKTVAGKGDIALLNTSTALYRQHSANQVGSIHRNTKKRSNRFTYKNINKVCKITLKSLVYVKERTNLINSLFEDLLNKTNNLEYDKYVHTVNIRLESARSNSFLGLLKLTVLYLNNWMNNNYELGLYIREAVAVIFIRKKARIKILQNK